MIDLKQIRHDLHKHPELSEKEKQTSEKIKNYLKKYNPDEIITNIGGYGIVAVFNTKKTGPSILLRAELDGLPIKEDNQFSYSSNNSGVSHACGHDGHMSILLGVAEKINENKNSLTGKIYLLFQPAEETAQGAVKIIESDWLKSQNIDYVFALHNLPGFKAGSIILRKNVFAATSKGLIVRLKGKSSHAGEPENGNNPIQAMNLIIDRLLKISKEVNSTNDRSLITIIHVKLGEVAFGTNPGEGVVMATFRSTDENKMSYMTKRAVSSVEKIVNINNLSHEIEWVEVFPILINNNECVDLIENVARKNSYEVIFKDEPFSWTEDFSYFTKIIKGAFFGLGSGKNHPQLHNSDYDFPDEITHVGVNMLFGIINEIITSNKNGVK